MNQDQPKPNTKTCRPDAAIEESLKRPDQLEKAGAPDFLQHLLSIPNGGPDDALERAPLNLRDFAW